MFGASDGVWVSGGSFSLRCAALTNRLHWSCEMGHFERQNAKQRRKPANFQTVLMIKQLEGGRHVLSNLCDVKKQICCLGNHVDRLMSFLRVRLRVYFEDEQFEPETWMSEHWLQDKARPGIQIWTEKYTAEPQQWIACASGHEFGNVF